MRRLPAILIVVAAMPAIAGCGRSSKTSGGRGLVSAPPGTSSPPTTGVTILAGSLPGLGPVPINAHRRTLYISPDNDKQVTCVSSCAPVWPPVKVSGDQKPLAAGPVKPSLLGSDSDPSGGRVVTYAGWPLYSYVADTSSGAAADQAENLNGSRWWVIASSGNVIHTSPEKTTLRAPARPCAPKDDFRTTTLRPVGAP